MPGFKVTNLKLKVVGCPFQKPCKYKVAISTDSQKYYHRYRSHSLVGDEQIPGQELLAAASGNNNGSENGDDSLNITNGEVFGEECKYAATTAATLLMLL